MVIPARHTSSVKKTDIYSKEGKVVTLKEQEKERDIFRLAGIGEERRKLQKTRLEYIQGRERKRLLDSVRTREILALEEN